MDKSILSKVHLYVFKIDIKDVPLVAGEVIRHTVNLSDLFKSKFDAEIFSFEESPCISFDDTADLMGEEEIWLDGSNITVWNCERSMTAILLAAEYCSSVDQDGQHLIRVRGYIDEDTYTMDIEVDGTDWYHGSNTNIDLAVLAAATPNIIRCNY